MTPAQSQLESFRATLSSALKVFTNGLFLGFLLASILVDQLSKLFVRDSLYLGEIVPVIAPLKIHYVTNTGALFGLFQGQAGILLLLSTLGVLLLLFFYVKSEEHTPGHMVCMGLILGGAIGNQIDRFFLNHVTDFIEIQGYPWIFNIADAAVVIGVTGIAALTIFVNSRIATTLSPEQVSPLAILWINNGNYCSYGDETWVVDDSLFNLQNMLPSEYNASPESSE
jgi:signal peptidase II